MLSTDPEDDLSQEQKGRSDQLGSRLKSLDARATKAQASEAEKFKVLRMVLDKIQDDAGVERISLDTLRDRYDQEIKSMESNALLDLNIHRAARRDLSLRSARRSTRSLESSAWSSWRRSRGAWTLLAGPTSTQPSSPTWPPRLSRRAASGGTAASSSSTKSAGARSTSTICC